MQQGETIFDIENRHSHSQRPQARKRNTMQKPVSPYRCSTSTSSFTINGQVFAIHIRRISLAA